MKHSRPGFAPRTDDQTPAKLNADMVPALHRKPLQESATLRQEHDPEALNARTAEAFANLAKQFPAPEIIVNPTPSEPPQVLEPGK